MFSSISEAKAKGGIFVGTQIRMLASEELEEQMSDLERNAWQAFRILWKDFLEIIEETTVQWRCHI